MTTRLLASFNVLDNHSKKILDGHARKNRLLSQMPRPRYGSSHDSDLPLSPECDSDVDFPSSRRPPISIPKTHSKTINKEQELLHNKLRCFTSRASKFSAPPPSVTDDFSCRPDNAISSRVSVRPFTSPEDLSRRRDEKRRDGLTDQEKETDGFMIITVKKKTTPSIKSEKHSSQRPKWSKEVEKVPPLEPDSDGSKAMVGGVLGYTDTSHWCSSPCSRDGTLTAFTEDERDQFSMSESVGKVVCQQLQRGNVVRVCTSRAPRSRVDSSVNNTQTQELSRVGVEAAAEAVPLSLADELERCVKLLTPRPPSVYVPLPIVSETYPVVSDCDPHPHKSLSSSGFHSLDPSEHSTLHRTTVHSAIVRITDSLQADTMVRRRREREREEMPMAQRNMFSGTHSVGLRALSADGYVTKDRGLGRLPLHSSRTSSSRGACLVPVRAPEVPMSAPIGQKRASSALGTVLNGVNPKLANDGVHLHCSKPQREPYGTKKKMILPSHHRESVNKVNNKKEFLFISKPLRNNKNNVRQFLTKQRHYKEWLGRQRQLCNNYMSEAVDINTIGVYGVNVAMSRPNSRVEYKDQDLRAGSGLPLLGPSIYLTDQPSPSLYHSDQDSEGSGTGTERVVSARTDCTFTSTSPFDPQQAINIPTAENVDLH